MNIPRRKFIGGAVGFAAFGFGRAFAVEPGSFSGGKPFFYFQHPHPANTVYGTFAWGRDRGKTTEALSESPERKPVEFAVRPLDAFLNAGRPILCTLKA